MIDTWGMPLLYRVFPNLFSGKTHIPRLFAIAFRLIDQCLYYFIIDDVESIELIGRSIYY